MLSACKNPQPWGRCTQCEYCRVLDRLDWVNRLKMEYGRRPYSFFITLDYNDENLPVFSNGLATLYGPDLDSFIDNIRNDLPKFTCFAVGEYGGHLFENPKASRPIHPHYHLAVFCDDKNIYDVVRVVVEKKWKYGHAHILRLSSGLIDYITGYVSKKLTNDHSMKKIMKLDIAPEGIYYASRRPAIGDITDELIPIFEEHGDVTHISIDGKNVVIPKYNRFKLKDYFLKWDLDLKTEAGKAEYERRKVEKKKETMQVLYEKNEAQMAEIGNRNMAGDVYEKKRQIRKQIVANFYSKHELKKHTKGTKVL